jgi:hypothetical protein
LTKYFGDVLMDFQNGCRLDLRVKLALEMLKSDQVPHEVEDSADGMSTRALTTQERAEYALELAGHLILGACRRGWIEDMPEGTGLSDGQLDHIKRVARAGVVQGLTQQRMAEDAASGVIPVKGKVQ